MSYDIYLNDPVTGETLHAEQRHHMAGGTYAVGGTTELWLNVTYNYSKHFCRVFKECNGSDEGIRSLYGLSGAESIPLPREAISRLGVDVDPDYWKPAEGSARQALSKLLGMAQLRPDGIWNGD